MDMQFSFTNVPLELKKQIQEALESGSPFGLTNGRTASLFHPKFLRSVFIRRTRTYLTPPGPTDFTYNSVQDMFNAISMALLSQKVFLNAYELKLLGFKTGIEQVQKILDAR